MLTTVAKVRMRELIVVLILKHSMLRIKDPEAMKASSGLYTKKYAANPEPKKHLAVSILKEIWYGQKI